MLLDSFILCIYQNKDTEKNAIANKKGIALISIPFWWDWDVSRYCKDISGVLMG
jgi:hypothetical protein